MNSHEKYQSEATIQSRDRTGFNYKTLLRLYKVCGQHYKRQWKLLALAYAGLLFSILLALLTPWPLKLILDYVIPQKPLPEAAAFLHGLVGTDPQLLLAALALAFIALQVSESVVTYFSKIEMLSLGEKIVTEIRERIFAHLQRLSLSFHESARSGDLVYRLTSDINDLKPALIDLPQNFVYRLAVIVSHVGLMLLLEWRLALLAFSIIPLLYVAHRRIGAGLHSVVKKKKSNESEMSAVLAENVTAMALVQAYGREDTQQARFALKNRASMTAGVEAMRLSKMFRRINTMLAACGTAGVVYWGGSLALEQAVLPGTVVLFVAYLRKLYGPLDKFAEMMLSVSKSQVAGERLLALLECDMIIQDGPRAIPAPRFSGHLEFRNVSFGYSRGAAVLKDLGFTVAPGQTVALLGHNGAGKSTLISLLLRFYDPQHGQILIDGRDIRGFKLQSLREQITVVMQEARLFNKTVRENIAFGKKDATEREIVQAAKQAQAHDFIMSMPDGYDTIIYEGGENLSGGQKQRINLARAIIRDTPIVILDEPDTALDAKTVARLQEALHALTRGKTAFIVAHKYSTVAHADKVLVLEQGRLVACGTHEELRRTSPAYRAAYAWHFGRQSTDANEPAGPCVVPPKKITGQEDFMMPFHDAALPNLATALDVSAMQEHFDRHLRTASPNLEWEPAQCAIEKVYYRPAHHCGILYRLTLRHPSGRKAEEWFFGRIYPPNGGCNQLERAGRAMARYCVSHEFLKRVPPVSFWHDLNMILWVFPQDPKITTLPAVIDPEFVRQEVQANLPAFGVAPQATNGKAGAWRCADLEYDRVKYMPSKRCVLRFHVNVVAPSGETRRVNFYSKTYSDGWSAYHFAMTKSLHEQLAVQTREVNLPQPLLHLDGFNTYWQAEWPGDALINVLPEQNWEELFPRIAAMIAALHRSRVEGLRPGPDPDDVMDTAREDGALLIHMLPQVQPFIRPVLEGLEAEKSRIDRQMVPAVPIHGAFRLEQMLVRDAELALVDFDAVSNGDPYYDIAEFLASLQYLEITRGFARQQLQRAAELFLRSYCDLTPGLKYDARRVAWYAQAFLLTKMFSSIKNLDMPALQRLESAGREIITGWQDWAHDQGHVVQSLI